MPLYNKNSMRLSEQPKGFGNKMENYEQVIAILELLKDLIVGLAWPTVLVFLLVFFRAESKRLFSVIAQRLSKTSELVLPGGIKLFSRKGHKTLQKELQMTFLMKLGRLFLRRNAIKYKSKLSP